MSNRKQKIHETRGFPGFMASKGAEVRRGQQQRADYEEARGALFLNSSVRSHRIGERQDGGARGWVSKRR